MNPENQEFKSNLVYCQSGDFKNVRSFTDLRNFLFNLNNTEWEYPPSIGSDGRKPLVIELDFALGQLKNNNQKYSLLFYSSYDETCMKLVDKIQQNYTGHMLFLVDSFETPEWFSDFKVTKVPKLVTSHGKFFHHEEYLPNIYRKLFSKPFEEELSDVI